jgi:hypothetical protein
MVGRSLTKGWLMLALAAAALALAAWFAPSAEQKTLDLGSQSTSLPTPDHSIAERGRLTIDAGSLRQGEVLRLELALADEAHTDEPLAVRVVSIDGRALDLSAVPAGGEGGGVQLVIDADWLQPGSYLIQVTTTEQSPFPLRRYVLEVQ